jgi:SAM-dependent methyltransferase
MSDALESGVPGSNVVKPAAMPEKMPQRRLMSRLAGRILRDTRRMLGLPSFLRNEDRRILEQIIFPHFLRNRECKDLLFVGCDWYTQGYNAWFEEKNYWTIDVDPTMRKFGAKQHIVDGLQNISHHFPRGSLDLIVCNGVFGWGLDDATAVEQAVGGCREVLRHGGILVIGVDGVQERRPYALEKSTALSALEPYTFLPLQTSDYLTDTPYRHRFLFFRKPLAMAGSLGSDEVKAPVQTSSKSLQPRSRGWFRSQDWSLSEAGETVGRIRQLLSAELKYLVGIDSYLESEDRRVLEEVVFPYFLHDDGYRNVLFVGCSWCTRGYNRRFELQKNYSTIDSSPWKRRYGAKRHIVTSLQDLGRHFQAGTLDLIICNGVYGWGLNNRTEIEAAFTACRESLREDGILIIGWDDCERLNPYPLSKWQCLRGFRPFVFPPLRSSEFFMATPHRHTYSFYRRPRAAELADEVG